MKPTLPTVAHKGCTQHVLEAQMALSINIRPVGASYSVQVVRDGHEEIGALADLESPVGAFDAALSIARAYRDSLTQGLVAQFRASVLYEYRASQRPDLGKYHQAIKQRMHIEEQLQAALAQAAIYIRAGPELGGE